MMQSEIISDLSAALAKAQACMKAATYNRVNPHFKNKYADLASVLDAIRKPMADNALSITQTTEIRAGGFALVTTLRHASGQWIASEYPLPQTARPQELGSAITYARRYSLSAIACIAADEDDDAEGARQSDQVATIKRDNPHVVKPEDTGEYQERIDPASGDVIDCIPVHGHRVQKLMPSKPETRTVAENLLKRMRECKTADALVKFAEETAEEWAALPDKWLGHYQAEYQMQLDTLRKQKAA